MHKVHVILLHAKKVHKNPNLLFKNSNNSKEAVLRTTKPYGKYKKLYPRGIVNLQENLWSLSSLDSWNMAI